MADFRIVSRPDCKWCSRAKSLLAVRGLEFQEDLKETRQAQLAFKDETGKDTFPQVWHGDSYIGGHDALKAYLEEHF